MKPVCYIVAGPASSGTRYVTRMFLSSGCAGDAGYRQPFDEELPPATGPIVWKTHAPAKFTAGKTTVPIKQAIQRAVDAGYEPHVVVVFRDEHCQVKSAIARGYKGGRVKIIETRNQIYNRIYRDTLAAKCQLTTISYDALAAYGKAYLRKFQGRLNLDVPKIEHPADQNSKYILEKDVMQTSDGYTLLKTERSGIPFYIRNGTVDPNVLDEVIVGDPYKLNAIKLRERPNIVDVGAHIGAFTKLCAWKWPHGKLYAYEANPRNWEVLDMNLADIKEKTVIYKGALVGKEPTNKRLVIREEEAARITGGWGIIYEQEEYEPEAGVAFEPIENFFYVSELFPVLDKVDILKLDCEGSEFSIIQEMTEEELYKVDYLVAEIHCGALPHHSITWADFRAKILKQFICPELDARTTVGPHDLFNIVACNRKLLP